MKWGKVRWRKPNGIRFPSTFCWPTQAMTCWENDNIASCTNRGRHCDITVPTRWQLSTMLLKLPHWCLTEELCGALQLGHNRVRNVQGMNTQNDCTRKMAVAVNKANGLYWMNIVFWLGLQKLAPDYLPPWFMNTKPSCTLRLSSIPNLINLIHNQFLPVLTDTDLCYTVSKLTNIWPYHVRKTKAGLHYNANYSDMDCRPLNEVVQLLVL